MSAILAFIFTLAQAGAAIVGYFKPIPLLFDAAVVYGSPLALLMSAIGQNSVAHETELMFPLIALFHVVKYITLMRSRFVEEYHSFHYMALILEISYLLFCAYYLF